MALRTAINFQILYTHTSVLTSRTCLNSVDMDASFDCKPTTTLDECDKRWRPFWCDCLWFRATSWSFAICWFRLFRSSLIMYVSSCISVGRSLKSDFLFATEIEMLYMYDLRRYFYLSNSSFISVVLYRAELQTVCVKLAKLEGSSCSLF